MATPINTTYSVHHLVGGDIGGTLQCFSIVDETEPPPGAPDDTVTFDAVPERIRTDIFGTVPVVTEFKTDNADGTHLLVIETSSEDGADLFPADVPDPDTGTPLTDACFFIGLAPPPFGDPLDWPGMDTVTAASISYLTDGKVVSGPIDVTDLPFFAPPWTGFFGHTFPGGAEFGINGVRLEILVEKVPQGDLGACCANGECVGDIEEVSCDFQGGNWHIEASCGADPTLPPPVCDQALCGFGNGLPLDDGGAVASQFAPDAPFAVAAADDFILKASTAGACQIRLVRAWVRHNVGGINPGLDYQGVSVTVYKNADPKGPRGRPVDDGTHAPSSLGDILFSQTMPMSTVTASPWSTSCVTNVWQLDIPVALVLNKNTKYWLEVQPVVNAALGRALWMLSENNNDHTAQQIGEELGISEWQDVPGNTDSCPGGGPPTPDAGTRRNLAFELLGEEITVPVNDLCANAITVGDGTTPINTLRATTDGAEEPEVCLFFEDPDVGADVWYEYFASCTGDMTVSLCGSDYDTKVAVYDDCGRCPPQSRSVACNDDSCGIQSRVTLGVFAGECYRIRVGGFEGLDGKGVMSISCETPPPPLGACCDLSTGDCRNDIVESECGGPQEEWTVGISCSSLDPPCLPPPPPHDECADAIEVFTNEPYPGSTMGSTGTDITSCTLSDTKDVWHRWVADCTGTAVVSLCGSSYDTSLAIFDACGGTELACNDDHESGRCPGDFDSEISPAGHRFVPIIAGQTYYIRVSGFRGATGDYILEVKSCANACCYTNPSDGAQRCTVDTPEQCASLPDGVPYEPGSLCLGDGNRNGIDDLCERPPPVWVWMDNNGDEPGGLMPDYDQNKDYDNADDDADPTTGVDPYYCGPTSVANAIWWLHHKFPGAGVVPPEYTKLELIEHLARRMGTNGTAGHPSPNRHPGPYAGTFLDDLQSGIDAYLADNRLSNLFSEHTEPAPSLELVADEVTQEHNVMLLVGFYRVVSVDPIGEPPNDGFVVHWRRMGGHYMTVAAVNVGLMQIGISDPDWDAAERGDPGYVRGPDHDHDGDGDPATSLPFRDRDRDHLKHNTKELASHDVYDALPSFTTGVSWILAVDGDPLAYGDLMASFHEEDAGGSFTPDPAFVERAFLEANGYPLPAPSQTYTAVEHVVIVTPTGDQACCLPDGTCTRAATSDCRLQGGFPLGPGSACEADGNGNGTDDACELSQVCESCGTQDHWVDDCTIGSDNLAAGVLVGLDLDLDCDPDVELVLAGSSTIWRSPSRDRSLNFPALGENDEHLDVIDTEIVAMSLTGGGVTLTAGAGAGRPGSTLRSSLGVTVEQDGAPSLADSFFDLFVELDLGGGLFRYNQTPLRMNAKIDCTPPNVTYVDLGACLALYDSPVAGQGTHVANLVGVNFDTFVECGSAAAGDCFVAHDAPYCNNRTCCADVCAQRALCCDVAWDLVCAGMAQVACPSCPEASIAQAEPPDNTVDARQPYAPNAPQLRQGIGSSAEPIVIALDPSVAGAEACFDLCETRPDPVDGDNMISIVTYLGNGEYEIVLDHPITVGAVTTIEYKADRSLVTYTSHPANADGNTTADGGDVVSVIDCCLKGTCQTAPGAHSCDIDHSGRPGPADMLRTIDLLNGATPYDPWSDTQRPVNLSCPIR